MLSVELDLDEVRVQHFRNLNRSLGEFDNWPGCYYKDYASFWAWQGGGPEVECVLGQLRDHYEKVFGESPRLNCEYADFLKGFVSSFSYKHDDLSIGHVEYAKFPIELLYDGEGDCECLSFLLASLFAHAGYQTAILVGYTKSGRGGGHAAVGLVVPERGGDALIDQEGTRYLYCEAVSSDRVGKCAFSFQVFSRHAEIWPITSESRWNGRPPAWNCSNQCGPVEPWVERCATCGAVAMFSRLQAQGDTATDWDQTLEKFLDWMSWVKEASPSQLGREIAKLASSRAWKQAPSGTRRYLEKALQALDEGDPAKSAKYVAGARPHLISAWPHVVASIFCSRPEEGLDDAGKGMDWIGTSVFKMDNRTLAAFARKILSDTTAKRIQGFSSGSRLAIGRILGQYEEEGEPYMTGKRQSIENILVKVVIPQVFSLLARERTSGL